MQSSNILIIFIVLLIGCQASSTEQEEPLQPLEPITSNNIIPFAVGNTWTYTDSLFHEDTVIVDTYTVRIQSKRHIEDEEFINRNFFGQVLFLIQTDGIGCVLVLSCNRTKYFLSVF